MRLILLVALLFATSYAQTAAPVVVGGCNVVLMESGKKCVDTTRVNGQITTVEACAQAVVNLPGNLGHTWFTYRQNKNRCEYPDIDNNDGGAAACDSANDNSAYNIYNIQCPPPTKSPTAVPTVDPTGDPTASPVFQNNFLECLDTVETGWACPDGHSGEISVDAGCCAWTRQGIDGDQYAYKELRMDASAGAIICTYPLSTGSLSSDETYFSITSMTESSNVGDLTEDSPCVYADNGKAVNELDDGISYVTTITYADGTCQELSTVLMESVWQLGGGSASSNSMTMNFFKDTLTYTQFQSLVSSYSVPYPENVARLEPYLDMDACIKDTAEAESNGKETWRACYGRAQQILTDIVGRGKFTFARHIWRNMRRITMKETDADNNDIPDCKEDNINGNCNAEYTSRKYYKLRKKFANLKAFYAANVYQP